MGGGELVGETAKHHRGRRQRQAARDLLQRASAQLASSGKLDSGLTQRVVKALAVASSHHGTTVPPRIVEYMGWHWEKEGEDDQGTKKRRRQKRSRSEREESRDSGAELDAQSMPSLRGKTA